MKTHNVILNGKTFYDLAIDSDIKTEQGEYYNSGCLLDYDYIKIYYRLIAADLIKKNQLLILKQLNKWEFVGQLKNVDGVNADGKQSMFILTILEKRTKERRLRFSQGR